MWILSREGKYLIIDINRQALGRYGLSVNDVNMIVESAIGGAPIGQTIEGRQRFTISVRLAQDYRNSIERLKRIPIQTSSWVRFPCQPWPTSDLKMVRR